MGRGTSYLHYLKEREPGLNVKMSTAVRMLIVRGLEHLEKEIGPLPPVPRGVFTGFLSAGRAWLVRDPSAPQRFHGPVNLAQIDEHLYAVTDEAR